MGNSEERHPLLLWGINLDELLFFIFVVLVGLIKGGPELVIIPPVLGKVFIITGCAAILFKIVCTSYTKREWFILVCLGLLTGVSTLHTHRMGLMVILILILGAKNIKLRKILVAFLSLHVLLFSIAVIPELIKIMMGGNVGGMYHDRNIYGIVKVSQQFRISMGFTHPNILQQNVCLMSILFMCFYKEHIKGWQIAVIALANGLFYRMTYSNTGLTIFVIFVLFYLTFSRYEKIGHFIAKYSRFIFALLVAINMLVVACFSDRGWMSQLNTIMVGRLYWAHQYLTALGMTFLGRDISEAGLSYMVVDNGYTYVLLRYGIIVFLFYCFSVYKLFGYLYKQGRLVDIIAVGVLHIYFIMENFVVAGLFNFTYVYLAWALYEPEFKKSADAEPVHNKSLNRGRKCRYRNLRRISGRL